MGAIIASSGNVLAGSPHAREAFVTGLSHALRINAGIALLAAVVAAATITAATRPGQAPPTGGCLARSDYPGASAGGIAHRVRRCAADWRSGARRLTALRPGNPSPARRMVCGSASGYATVTEPQELAWALRDLHIPRMVASPAPLR
jgi:hypothetical protein